jgi:hypothetical protein
LLVSRLLMKLALSVVPSRRPASSRSFRWSYLDFSVGRHRSSCSTAAPCSARCSASRNRGDHTKKRSFRCPASTDTSPEAPEPAPPAPPDVPPAPAPLALPKPPTPPPGVFCTTPVLTPRNDAARLRAQDVGLPQSEVVSRDRDVEIVLKRQRDRILQRQLQHAIVTSVSIRGELASSAGIPAWRDRRSMDCRVRNIQTKRGLRRRTVTVCRRAVETVCWHLSQHGQLAISASSACNATQAQKHLTLTPAPPKPQPLQALPYLGQPSIAKLDRPRAIPAFASECVTCTIVVPCSFSFRNSSIISFACVECRLPVGSSASKAQACE